MDVDIYDEAVSFEEFEGVCRMGYVIGVLEDYHLDYEVKNKYEVLVKGKKNSLLYNSKRNRFNVVDGVIGGDFVDMLNAIFCENIL